MTEAKPITAQWKAATPSALLRPEPIAGDVGQKPKVISRQEKITMPLVLHGIVRHRLT